VERNFAGIAEEVKRKVVFDNAVKLYAMNVG
jgi:hypothetical protein